MSDSMSNPRILVVTPEVTYLPNGMGNMANHLKAKAGGLADVSAALVSALFEQGADVHVAIPDYRAIFGNNFDPILTKELNAIRRSIRFEYRKKETGIFGNIAGFFLKPEYRYFY